MNMIRSNKGRRPRRGAISLEYGLVVAFVAITVLAALGSLVGNLDTSLGTVGGKMEDAGNAFK